MKNEKDINKTDKDVADEDQYVIRPLTKADCPKMTQLQIDAINVLEHRVNMEDFPKEYQRQIENFYRFSPVDAKSNNAVAAQGGRSFWK